MRSDPTLKRLYRQYNRRYFSNKLPKGVKVMFASSAEMKRGGLGKSVCAITCWYEAPRLPSIFIRRTRDKVMNYVKADLLHEMVHVARPELSHSRRADENKFQKEMLRLAKRGAFKGCW